MGYQLVTNSVNNEYAEHVPYFQFRLAKEMSDKIAKDEENLENVNIKNRPMKVAEEYENFCSNAWFLAKGKLDYNDVPNEKALIALADILKVASLSLIMY